jgi:hypothetical protein
MAGEDSNRNGFPNKNALTSEFVDRSGSFHQPALKNVIVNSCRCCGYIWDAQPMDESIMRKFIETVGGEK